MLICWPQQESLRAPHGRAVRVKRTVAFAATLPLPRLRGRNLRRGEDLRRGAAPGDSYLFSRLTVTSGTSAPGVTIDTDWWLPRMVMVMRSEEHTSELQSRGHLVCRLLLEK